MNALKLLANQQKDGDSPVNMVVQVGFAEKSWLRVMNKLKSLRFGEEHGVETSAEGENFAEECELTLQREEDVVLRSFIDTTDIADGRWEVACHWSSHFPRCRRFGMGDHVLQVQGVASSGQM